LRPKRQPLVGTEGPVLEAWVHSSRVPDAHGSSMPSEKVRDRLRRLSHPWVDAGYRGSGKRWAEEVLGLTVEDTRKPPKSVPQEVARPGPWDGPRSAGRRIGRSQCRRRAR
jgi:hypothetical protein